MNRIWKNICLGLLVCCMFSCETTKKDGYKFAYLYKDLPFKMDKVYEPEIPDFSADITDFGGVGDGEFKNTEAFAKAISAIESNGGGTLNVPQGVWLTGPIVLKSNLNLHLEKGALLIFTRNYDDYPLVNTVFEGLDTRRCQSPISGRNLKNVAITGEGFIDGSGDFWRPVKKFKVTDRQWKGITSRGGAFKRDNYWFPSEKALKGDALSDMNVPKNLKTEEEWESIKDFLRPVMVSLIECENVLLQGVCFSNSPSWNLHPLMCKNVIIDHVSVRNPSYAQNGDGLDLESCVNALIINSLFTVGDDGICIKSGKDEDGRKRGRPCENVIIDNCTVYHGHGGFVVGSEMSGGVKNIKLSTCSFLGTDVGLRFKSKRGRGGVVDNIYISDVTMQDIAKDAITFNLYYGAHSGSEKFPVTEETPCFKNLYFKNIVSSNSRRAMYFRGLPEMKIDGIHLEDIQMTAKSGAEFLDSENISLKNVRVKTNDGPVFTFNNISNVELSHVSYSKDVEKALKVPEKELSELKGYETCFPKDKIIIK